MGRSDRRRGTALLAVLVFVMLLGSLGAALLQVDLEIGESRRSITTDQRAFYASEAGISEAWVALSLGNVDPGEGQSVALGSAAAPRRIGDAEYWSSVTKLDARRFEITAVGRDGQSVKSQEVIVSYAPDGFFQYAAFGGTGVRLDSNAFIDSYDSLLGDYASQVRPGEDWARENAVVGSNEDIRLRSNTRVHGDVRPGPGRTADVSAPGIVVTGTTEPADELVELPPIEPPIAVSEGDRDIATDVTLGPGLVRLDDVLVSSGATVTVQGPCELVVSNFRMRSGTTIVFEPGDGPIDLYADDDFVLESNTEVVTNSDSAVDVQLFLAGDNRRGSGDAEVELSANSEFIGAIYAPNATVSLGSNFEIFGSVMAGELDLSSNGIIHFDEALLYDGDEGIRNLVTLAWRRRAPEVGAGAVAGEPFAAAP